MNIKAASPHGPRPRRDPVPKAVAALLALIAAGCTIWYLLGTEGTGKNRRSTARIAGDASYYHVYLPSLLFDGDVDFTDEYRETRNWYRFGTTPLGKPANAFGVGPALYEVPLFLVGHLIARIGGARHDGFSDLEVKLSLWASVLFSVAAMWFAWRLAERRLLLADPDASGRWLAFAGVFLAFAAGPVIYYGVRQPGYAHPFATFWTAWFLERWDASFDGDERTLRAWAALGALLGAMALARPQVAAWGIVLIPAAVADVRKLWRFEPLRAAPLAGRVRCALTRLAPRWVVGGAVALLVFTPQMLVWKTLYGSFYTMPQGPGFMRWDSPAWSEVLFSSRNGLFPWSPAYALFAVGLVAASRRAPRPATWMLVGVALQAIVNGAAWDWWGGGAFGGRRFDSCFVALAFGAAYLLLAPAPALRRRWKERRWPLFVPAGIGAAAMAGVILLLAAANLHLAARTSPIPGRNQGGEAAARVIRAEVAGPAGGMAAVVSSIANFPARAVFAWRHGTSLGTYDRVVGVHLLGETYPGLDSFQAKTVDSMALKNAASPFVDGFVPANGGLALAGDRARILVPLNREGGVRVSVFASGGAGGEVTLRWNGSDIGGGVLGEGLTEVAGEARSLRRGVNEVEVRAPAGTRLQKLDLRALP
jgi:hypothetical protein